ncbi:MAG: hypothetical protein AAB074_02750 [Planctomycetota bacterium]
MLLRGPAFALLTAVIVAGCSKKPLPSEDKSVLDSYEAALFMPDPDLNVLLPHAAWLGPAAVPPVLKLWPTTVANDVKRIKLARLLEILAWNGFRTVDSVRLLSGLAKDRQVFVRKSAVNALFASAAELDSLDKYWDPADPAPGNVVNPSISLKLPFANCRELLAKRGLAIAKNADGSVAGAPGRTHAAQPGVPQAIAPLRKWWSAEPDPSLRIYSAIQALRARDPAAIEPLVAILGPLPAGAKTSASLDAARACSLRALQESTGLSLSTYEQWQEWREQNRTKPGSPR